MNKKYIITTISVLLITNLISTAPTPSKKSTTKSSAQKTKANAPIAKIPIKKEPAPTTPALVVENDWVEVDSIKATIYSEGDAEIITASEVTRPSVAGQVRTLDDIIFEYLVFLDAKRHKIMTDDASVDRYLDAIQKEHNLKPEQLKQIFSQAGYSFEEGRAQLQMIQATNAMLDFKIRSNLIVPRRQAEEYYKAHPELEEEAFQLQTGVITHKPGKNRNDEREEIEQFAQAISSVASNKDTVSGDASAAADAFDVKWSTDFWVNKSDIATDQKFIYTMKPGQVVIAQETADGYILYKLKARKEEKLRSFDDRYLEIADILRKPRYEELLQEYRNYLFKNAAIVTF